MKTWADGETISPADMKKYVSGPLRGLLAPPACRRTVANLGSEQKPARAWHTVQFDKPGAGAGKAHSYDTTGGLMSADPFKITAPLQGLYEVSAGVVVRAVSGSLTFAVASVNRNETVAGDIAHRGFLRFGLGRASASEKVGQGSATVALAEGHWISMAVNPETAAYLGANSNAQILSHLEMRWVGAMP
ncbi:hypothetical protein ABT354_11190 [Streptomyces sp. NPDC000594]|uniref:hypothetical protein n=1 Tax=Streptomyces sp. NPDC000594 TaxID=3154261 RepID=UPI0033179C21